jgi:hypothetical protein
MMLVTPASPIAARGGDIPAPATCPTTTTTESEKVKIAPVEASYDPVVRETIRVPAGVCAISVGAENARRAQSTKLARRPSWSLHPLVRVLDIGSYSMITAVN